MNHDGIDIVYGLLLLILLISSFISGRRYQNIPFLKYTLYWIGLFISLMLVYVSMGGIAEVKDKIMAQLIPGHVIANGDEILIKRAQDNHFYIYVNLNDKPIRFMVDTGATNVVISEKLAAELGIDPNNLKFIFTSYTANGEVRTAKFNIGKFQVADLVIYNFPINITDGDLDTPLLGMSFLGRLKSYQFQGDSLYLKY